MKGVVSTNGWREVGRCSYIIAEMGKERMLNLMNYSHFLASDVDTRYRLCYINCW